MALRTIPITNEVPPASTPALSEESAFEEEESDMEAEAEDDNDEDASNRDGEEPMPVAVAARDAAIRPADARAAFVAPKAGEAQVTDGLCGGVTILRPPPPIAAPRPEEVGDA